MTTPFANLGNMAAATPGWLWEGRIPLGSVTILDGDPGSGKSAVAYDLAARVSRGAAMPDGSQCGAAGGVVLLQAEDDLRSRVIPALAAAGADTCQIVAADQHTEEPLMLPEAMDQIAAAVASVNARLVIIDPFSAYVSTTTNGDQSVRRVLGRLAALAKRQRLAVLVVRHLTKRGGGNPLYRGLGSIGIIGFARSALTVGCSPNVDAPYRHVLALNKSNLGSSPSLQYRTVCDDSGTITIEWLGEIECSAEQFASVSGYDAKAISEAKRVLLDLLSDGPVPSKQMIRQAQEAGVSRRTLDRAKHDLGVMSDKRGSGVGSQWFWLPPGVERLSDWDVDGAASAADVALASIPLGDEQ